MFARYVINNYQLQYTANIDYIGKTVITFFFQTT